MDLVDRSREYVLAAFRILVGLLFACHGTATLFDVLGGPHGGVPDAGEWPGWYAAVIQLVGGVMVAVGLYPRSAAVLCSGSMAYAYFTEHQTEALFPIENGGEASVMFCWTFLIIAFFGPGRWTLSSALAKARANRGEEAPAVSV